ncbi:MAG: hypothetical protein DYG92_14060 [Leptolyngbya sp. PLA1]|nr:hypothetical protein [Leptolyngbya sp. PLA1]
MAKVFLSFAGGDREAALYAQSALDALGADVYCYQDVSDRDTPVNTSLSKKLANEASEADIFIMLLHNSMGGPVEADAEHRAFLRYEFDAFYQQLMSGGKQCPPVILQLPSNSPNPAVDEFAAWLAARDMAPERVPSGQDFVAKAVRAYHAFALSVETPCAFGYFDRTYVEHYIDDELIRCINTRAVFPQRFLYATALGARLWLELAGNRNGKIGKVYGAFTFGSKEPERRDPETGVRIPGLKEKVLAEIAKWPGGSELPVIVLGCGDARREATICRSLQESLPQRRLRVLLVDVSKTLIGHASRVVKETTHENTRVDFALLDFEDPRILRTILREWCARSPCLVLFLGNTLGNINELRFLDNVADALRPHDLLLIETVKDSAEPTAPQPATAAGVMNPEDPRFEFFAAPIRTFGLVPRRQQMRRTQEASLLGTLERYSYVFTSKDVETLAGSRYAGKVSDQSQIELVNIQRMVPAKLEAAAKSRFTGTFISERSYPVTASHVVTMIYCLATK